METNVDYAPYRKEMIEKGNEYQDYVCMQLYSKGIVLQNMTSRKYQYKRENLLGLEIKFDDRSKDTGRLYIETAEKKEPRSGDYAPAGIYRDDNAWLYGIGDYETFYIFSKKFLRRIDKKKPDWIYIPNTPKPTSIGFCIPISKAIEFAERVIQFKEASDIHKPEAVA